jgi:hypothetical protein
VELLRVEKSHAGLDGFRLGTTVRRRSKTPSYDLPVLVLLSIYMYTSKAPRALCAAVMVTIHKMPA